MKIFGITEDELNAFGINIVERTIKKYLEIPEPQKQPVSFIDTEEYGKETGKHPITIRRWIHKGLLTGYKVGGRLMIDREEANALIRQKKVSVRKFPAS